MLQIFKDYPLLSHNTFGIPCQAATFVTYESAADVTQLVQEYPGATFLPLGMGSNLLFLRPSYEGVVLHSLNRDLQVVEETEREVVVKAGAGWNWDDFVFHAISQGWYGLENLSYIPGEVGASAVQNVGAFGVEAGELIESVEAVDLRSGNVRHFSHADLQYAYRDSFFKQPHEVRQWAIISVTYRLSRSFCANLSYGGLRREVEQRGLAAEALSAMEMRELVIAVRRGKLPEPSELGSAGSFFKNPIVAQTAFEAIQAKHPGIVSFPAGEGLVKLSAGWMIDQLGWRGRNVGRAGVYEKQALVLVNRGGATGEEIQHLCELVSADVEAHFGVHLEPEVNFIA